MAHRDIRLEKQLDEERKDIARLDRLIEQQTGLLKVHGRLKEKADLLLKTTASMLVEDEKYINDLSKAIEGFVQKRRLRDTTRKQLINLLESTGAES